MCGIVGLWQWHGMAIEPAIIKKMTDSLAHRGPDSDGVYIDKALGLGHRRLAILDLSPAGHQPMSYANERYWITYNGEIYNFLEIKEVLEKLGHCFQSASDTEVILAAYAEWGTACQYRFNGMWAFAIWDAKQGTLFLSRDRFGIKPLFYVWERDRFAFASEIKAFFPLPEFSRQVDWSVFATALEDPYVQGGLSETLLHGVFQLLPGHCLLVRLGDVKVLRWWDTLDNVIAVPTGLAAQAQQFYELFSDACRLRMRSDVPIATCLSGGLDSSSIVCMLAEISRGVAGKNDRTAPSWQKAFIATFPDTAVDERSFADLVVRQTNIEAFYVTPTADDFLKYIDRVVYHLEGLDAGLMVQLWCVYQSMRQRGMVVTLDGHGGDELLGGYSSHVYAGLQQAGKVTKLPGRYLDLLRTYEALFRSDEKSMRPDLDRKATILATHQLVQLAQRKLKEAGGKPAEERSSLGRSDSLSLEAMRPARSPAPTDVWAKGMTTLDYVYYRLFHQTMLPTILRNFDRMSMAHGVEIRMPFLDWRLVQFVFSVPAENRMGQGYTKLILREAMRGLLPEAIRTRRDKLGFTPPMADWFGRDLQTWLRDMLRSRIFRQCPAWDGKRLQASMDEAIRQGSLSWNVVSRIWPYLHATLWLQQFQ